MIGGHTISENKAVNSTGIVVSQLVEKYLSLLSAREHIFSKDSYRLQKLFANINEFCDEVLKTLNENNANEILQNPIVAQFKKAISAFEIVKSHYFEKKPSENFDIEIINELHNIVDTLHHEVFARLFEFPEVGTNISLWKKRYVQAVYTTWRHDVPVGCFTNIHHKVDPSYFKNYEPTLHEVLKLAAACGHLSIVKGLLQNAAIIDNSSAIGDALFAALDIGHFEVVKCLLESSEAAAKVKESPSEALERAAGSGDLSVVNLLLDFDEVRSHAGDQNNAPLKVAADKHHLAVCKRLLQLPSVVGNIAGVYPGAVPFVDGSLVSIAAHYGDVALFEQLLAIPQIKNCLSLQGFALVTAANRNHIVFVDRLLQSPELLSLLQVVGNPLQWEFQVALSNAAKRGHDVVVNQLFSVIKKACLDDVLIKQPFLKDYYQRYQLVARKCAEAMIKNPQETSRFRQLPQELKVLVFSKLAVTVPQRVVNAAMQITTNRAEAALKPAQVDDVQMKETVLDKRTSASREEGVVVGEEKARKKPRTARPKK